MRNLPNKASLLRIVSVATAGSGVYSVAASSDYNTSVSVSVPPPWLDSLKTAWRNVQENPMVIPLNNSNHGTASPVFFSRPDSLTDPDINGTTARDDSDGSKHSCNCLGRDTIAKAAAKTAPAVVNLSVTEGFRGYATGKNMGSGTIIDEDGTILTCAHVVVNSQTGTFKSKVEVTLKDGRVFEGTVLHADLHADVAILKINSKTPLPAAKLGNSSELRSGDWVVAMGCPLSLQNTITAGIVSCVDRKSSELGLGGMQREYLQTDCAINEGNSGGPLVNLEGEIVGVNVMKMNGAQGLNFALPIDTALTIMKHFRTAGRVIRPWLGLKMIDLNEMIVANLKERNVSFPDTTIGVLAPMVFPGGPADRAGFRPGDVVVEFDGKPITSIKEVLDIMGDKVGKPVEVVVKRANNVTETLTVTPEEANSHM